ncbi:DUF3169 family protein [Streptococcus gallolyticus]|nr:DUF3169 family protein [Streptococcus gallolyticus]MBY5040603.1 DUF3169 family protein [Streptococcus gallolyticus]
MNKKNTVFKKRMIYFFMYGLTGLLLGYFAPALVGVVNGLELSLSTARNTLLLLTNLAFVLAFLMGIIFFQLARKVEKDYNEADMDDDQSVNQLYTRLYRNMEYAVVIGNIEGVLAIFNVMLGSQLLFQTNGAELSLSMYGFLELILLSIFQTRLFKMIERIRQFKLSVFSTVSEIKAYVNSYDEGERQTNFEQSFMTLFNLNQKVLPILYVVVFAVSVISQSQQLMAYLVVAFIHIYINLSQYRMVREYFK